MENKLGIVKLSRRTGFKNGEQYINFLKELWKVVTPVHSIYYDRHHGTDYDLMLCYSEKFREIEVGEIYPEYLITVKRDKDNVIKLIETKELKDGEIKNN